MPPRLLVDADACPVKDECARVAARYGVEMWLVADGGIRPSRDPMVRVVIVPGGADAADDRIVEECRPGDVVVTADIPLARRVLEIGAAALGPTGRPFTEETIGMAMAMRGLKQQIREETQTQTRNRGFTNADRSIFLQALDRALSAAVRKGTTP